MHITGFISSFFQRNMESCTLLWDGCSEKESIRGSHGKGGERWIVVLILDLARVPKAWSTQTNFLGQVFCDKDIWSCIWDSKCCARMTLGSGDTHDAWSLQVCVVAAILAVSRGAWKPLLTFEYTWNFLWVLHRNKVSLPRKNWRVRFSAKCIYHIKFKQIFSCTLANKNVQRKHIP